MNTDCTGTGSIANKQGNYIITQALITKALKNIQYRPKAARQQCLFFLTLLIRISDNSQSLLPPSSCVSLAFSPSWLFIFLPFSFESICVHHTQPVSNNLTSSSQSGSMRSAGFSPLSFSASVLAPFDSRYLSKTGEENNVIPGACLHGKDHKWIYNFSPSICQGSMFPYRQETLTGLQTEPKCSGIQRCTCSVLPCYFWIAVTAGHVKRRPAILVPLMNICAVFYKQLHHLQVSSQHSFMQCCHACAEGNITSSPFLSSGIFNRSLKMSIFFSRRRDLSHLSGRACQFGPSSPSWTDRFAPYLPVSRCPGRRCHWGSARSSLRGRRVWRAWDFPAFACAVWSCT